MAVNQHNFKIIVWERSNKLGKWLPYSPELSKYLEESFKKDATNVCLGDVDQNLKIYSANFKDMMQVSEVTGTKLTIRRKLCDGLGALGRGFSWQWLDDDEVWNIYDADVNDYIDTAFLEGKKSISLYRKFGYPYEIHFTKMMQVNKKNKHKRKVQRLQNTTSYPVESSAEEPMDIDSEHVSFDNKVPKIFSPEFLAQEIPGTSDLLSQANAYKRHVEISRLSPSDQMMESKENEALSKHMKISEDENLKKDSHLNQSSSVSETTVALVNGKPYTGHKPPHTPKSELKPVPGIEPLPKNEKPKRKSKGKGRKRASLQTCPDETEMLNVFEKYTKVVDLSPDISNETCIICCESLSNGSSYNDDKTLSQLILCLHIFHKACLEAMYDSGNKEFLQCPSCKRIHGEKYGIQPPGEMIFHVIPYSLPGYPECDTIRILYDFHSGIQDKENRRLNIEKIFSSDPITCLEGVVELKNCVIGSNKSKGLVMKLGAVPRLYQILLDKSSSEQLLVEAAVTVGSLARGSEQHVQELLSAGLLNVMLQGLGSPNPKLMEACLRCLRTVFSRKEAPIDVLYTEASLIPHLVQMAKERSPSVQECVMTMLYCGCQTPEHQDILCENGVLDLLAPLLCCNIYRVQIPSLKCLAQMCYQNEKVSELAASSSYERKSVPDILVTLMSRDKNTEMQLASAKCMTYMFRSGALTADDSRIVYKALPTLVRMCQKDVAPEERVDGAETLAYLTEVDTELQRIASISDHLIPTLSELLKFRAPNQNGVEPMDDDNSKNDYSKASQEVKMAQEMKQAAFKAFASLAANDEEIRKKIIDTDTLMENVVNAFSDPSPRVRLAAVRCLHSLSRSVQQLRTTFQDHAVWRPLMKLLHNADDDILTVASSTLCNLLLEFSPSKEPILECGAVELLCGLTRRDDPSLRLNGVWALMNMAFQADHKIKAQILTALGSEHVFRLLSDSDVDVLMKTLGLLRNLLSTKPHIDHIMGLHGKQVMQAIVLILEGDHNSEVKEQALCILANIADGDFAKNFIMSNEDVLKKLTTYMMHSNVKLQIAATFCISNLVWKEEEGALERQAKLKELGVQQLLQQLLSTSDTTLFDRVKTALHQFPSQGT